MNEELRFARARAEQMAERLESMFELLPQERSALRSALQLLDSAMEASENVSVAMFEAGRTMGEIRNSARDRRKIKTH